MVLLLQLYFQLYRKACILYAVQKLRYISEITTASSVINAFVTIVRYCLVELGTRFAIFSGVGW